MFNNNNLNGVGFNDIYCGFNYMNNKNDNSISKYIIRISYNSEQTYYIKINPKKTIKDLLNEIYLKFYYSNIEQCSMTYNAGNLRKIDKSLKLSKFFVTPYPIILICKSNNLLGGGASLLEKEINIKFIKLLRQILDKKIYNFNLFGLLKLCLLKEISLKLNNYQISQLPIFLSSIMEILKNGKIDSSKNKECIKEILNKIRGSNIITFSRYVDKVIGFNYLQNIFNFLNRNDFY